VRIKGVVLPAATESVTLLVRHVDGSVTRGESAVRETGKAVARVTIEPPSAAAPTRVLAAIERADFVVLSAGSLYTSTIPALLGGGVAEALAAFRRPVVYAANLMTQPGETLGFTVADHLRAITEHVGPVVTDVLVNSATLPDQATARYRVDGAAPVEIDGGECERLGIRVHEVPLLPDTLAGEVRHDPDRVAEAICSISGRTTVRGVSDVKRLRARLYYFALPAERRLRHGLGLDDPEGGALRVAKHGDPPDLGYVHRLRQHRAAELGCLRGRRIRIVDRDIRLPVRWDRRVRKRGGISGRPGVSGRIGRRINGLAAAGPDPGLPRLVQAAAVAVRWVLLGGRGRHGPPAPSELGMRVSRDRALLTSRACGCIASGRTDQALVRVSRSTTV
jgi:hypothetical protein